MNDTVETIEAIKEIVAYEDEKNPWVKLYFDQVRFPNGATGFYNRIVESGGKPGVAILPIRDETIGLLRQYRYPVHATLWEIPRGFGEIGVPEKDAIRELEEETGIVVGFEDLQALGVLHPNSGLLDSEVHLFAAKCRLPAEETTPPQGGEERLTWLRFSAALEAIGTGEIRDSFTISAVTRAMLQGILPGIKPYAMNRDDQDGKNDS